MLHKVYYDIEDYFHQQTFGKEWVSECGNGNKKLDEIQIFLQFLQNKNEAIASLEYFLNNFKYKEKDVEEPGDLEYLGQKYQITHGIKENYAKTKRSIGKGVIILPISDFTKYGYEYYLADINKENAANSNIILLVRIDRMDFEESNSKIKTVWKDYILIFDDKNISIKE